MINFRNIFKRKEKILSKSIEHLMFEAENSPENNQRKQDMEDNNIERCCREEADRLFWKQLEYSDTYKERTKTILQDSYNPNKIYRGLIFVNLPFFGINMYSGAKSRWDKENPTNYVLKLLEEKIRKWENNEL